MEPTYGRTASASLCTTAESACRECCTTCARAWATLSAHARPCTAACMLVPGRSPCCWVAARPCGWHRTAAWCTGPRALTPAWRSWGLHALQAPVRCGQRGVAFVSTARVLQQACFRCASRPRCLCSSPGAIPIREVATLHSPCRPAPPVYSPTTPCSCQSSLSAVLSLSQRAVTVCCLRIVPLPCAHDILPTRGPSGR
jgi:hypothetical protein